MERAYFSGAKSDSKEENVSKQEREEKLKGTKEKEEEIEDK